VAEEKETDMYPALEILRRPGRFFFALFLIALTASTASAQGCYQFSGSGATLQINITSFVNRFDNQPSGGGYDSNDTFVGTNKLTVGGATTTTQSTANTPDCVGCLLGSAVFSYSGGGDLTVITMTVPANDITGSGDGWFVTLGGVGNEFPTGVLPSPQAFPPISSWAVNSQITVAVGSTMNSYAITSIGACSSSSSGGPQPAIDGVETADAFGGFSSVSPGSWIEIYGTNFASEAQSWTGADFTGNDAPTSLGGISVSLGGQAAFVDYISGGQVNVQLPSNISSGTLPLTLTNGSGTSAPVNLTVNATQPGLFAPTGFQVGGKPYVAAQHADGTYVLPIGAIGGITSHPAQPGETIVMYGVGFGPVTPNIPAGEIATVSNQLVTPLTIQFGSTPAQLPFPYAGLSPGSVGLYQFNVVVPLIPDNELVPLTINLGSVAGTQTLYTAVQQ
jgi:uncharacterized protein (TIGR03437 family)